MLVFRISEERTTDKVLNFKVVNKFFIPLKGNYYTTLPYIIQELDEELEYDFEKLRLKIISLLKEYHDLNLKETITEVRFIPDKNRQTPGCDEYYTLLALGFTNDEAIKILNKKEFGKLYELVIQQLSIVIKEAFSLSTTKSKLVDKIVSELRYHPHKFTVPDLITLTYELLTPKIRVSKYGIKKLPIVDKKNYRESLYNVITYWLFNDSCLKGLKQYWIINPHSGIYHVQTIGDFYIIKKNSAFGKETIDAKGVVKNADTDDAIELIKCLPKINKYGDLVFTVNIHRLSNISDEYVRVRVVDGKIKVVTTCFMHFDKSTGTLFVVFKKEGKSWMVKFDVKQVDIDYYIKLPGIGEVKLIVNS